VLKVKQDGGGRCLLEWSVDQHAVCLWLADVEGGSGENGKNNGQRLRPLLIDLRVAAAVCLDLCATRQGQMQSRPYLTQKGRRWSAATYNRALRHTAPASMQSNCKRSYARRAWDHVYQNLDCIPSVWEG